MILFDALYINEGGGKVLLEYIVQTLIKQDRVNNFHFLLDSRLKSDYLDHLANKTITIASENNRKKFYRCQIKSFRKIFCFGNVPPPIKVSDIPVYVFCQNAHLLNPFLSNGSFSTKLKWFAKCIYIKQLNHRLYTWIVQTPHLQKLLSEKITGDQQSILLMPFFEKNRFVSESKRKDTGPIKFLYIASGQLQKNHAYLFDVWELLYEKYELNFPLYITIETPTQEQSRRITNLQDKGIKVINLGKVSFEEVGALYTQCQYLVFPSFIESFGLPLVEATDAGCKVLANDSPYVYEVIKPSAVFDVKDKNSLAKVILDINAGHIPPSPEVRIKDHTEELLQLL